MILVTKFFFWLRTRYKGLFFLFITLAIIFYAHNEYVNWANVTGNVGYLGYSYILKNVLLVLIVLIYFIVTIKRSIASRDGFDSLRKKEKLTSSAERILTKDKAERSSTEGEKADEGVFDSLRNKEKLTSKAERILQKKRKRDPPAPLSQLPSLSQSLSEY